MQTETHVEFFYATSKEEYLFLKKAHRLLLRAYIDVKRFIRWKNKTKHRKGPEPKVPEGMVCTAMHQTPLVVKYSVNKQPIGKIWYGLGFKTTGGTSGHNYYLYILELYRLARTAYKSEGEAVAAVHGFATRVARPACADVEQLVPADLKKVVEKLEEFYQPKQD